MTKHPYTKLNSDYFDTEHFESFKIDEKIVQACQDRGLDVKAESKIFTTHDIHGNFKAFEYWMAYHFIPATQQTSSFGTQPCFVQFYNDCYDNLSLVDQNQFELNEYYFDESEIAPKAQAYLEEHGIEDDKQALRLVDYQKWHGAKLVPDWAHQLNLPIDLNRHLISYQFYPLYRQFARQLAKRFKQKPAQSSASSVATSTVTSVVSSVSSKSNPPESDLSTVSDSSNSVEPAPLNDSNQSKKTSISSVMPSSSSVQSSIASISSNVKSIHSSELTSSAKAQQDKQIADDIIEQKVAESAAKHSAALNNFVNELKQSQGIQSQTGVGSVDDLSQLAKGLGGEGLGDIFNLTDDDDEDDNTDITTESSGYDDNYETTSSVVASEAHADLPFETDSENSQGSSSVTVSSSIVDSVDSSSSSVVDSSSNQLSNFGGMFANPDADSDTEDDFLESSSTSETPDTGVATHVEKTDDTLNVVNLKEIQSVKPNYLSTKDWFVHIPQSRAKELALDVMPVIKTDYLLNEPKSLKHLYIHPNAMVTVREMFAGHILQDDALKELMFSQRSQRQTTNYEVSDNDVQESFDMYVSVALGLYSQTFWKRYCAGKVITQLSTKTGGNKQAPKMRAIDNLKKFKSIHQVLFNHNKAAKKGPNEVSATIRYYLALGLQEPNLMDKTVNSNYVNRQLQRMENSQMFLRQLTTLILNQMYPDSDWSEIVNSKGYKRLVKKMDVLWPDMVNPLKTMQRTNINKFRKS